MAQLPVHFPRTPSTAIASYDFADLASGLAIQEFFLGVSVKDDASISYVVVDAAIHSDFLRREITHTTGGGTTEYNFDSPEFQVPRIVSGTAYITTTIFKNAADGHAIFRILKYDGSTETQIAAAVTTDKTEGASATSIRHLRLACTDTLIKEGEQLRIEVVLGATGSGTVAIGADPKNNSSTNITVSATATTVTTIGIPFKTVGTDL